MVQWCFRVWQQPSLGHVLGFLLIKAQSLAECRWVSGKRLQNVPGIGRAVLGPERQGCDFSLSCHLLHLTVSGPGRDSDGETAR